MVTSKTNGKEEDIKKCRILIICCMWNSIKFEVLVCVVFDWFVVWNHLHVQAASEWLYVVPWGIRKLLNYVKEKYHNPPIYITENGIILFQLIIHPDIYWLPCNIFLSFDSAFRYGWWRERKLSNGGYVRWQVTSVLF